MENEIYFVMTDQWTFIALFDDFEEAYSFCDKYRYRGYRIETYKHTETMDFSYKKVKD